MTTNATQSRVRALLKQMTLDEKIAQLGAYMFFDTFWHTHGDRGQQERIDFVLDVKPEMMIPPEGLGLVSTQLRDLPPRLGAEIANRTQEYARTKTRLGIPVTIQDEGVHGLIGFGATCYPSALAFGASWNPTLLERIAQAIGLEARVKGVRQLLSPTLNLGLDARNGRTEETYGEDPYLAGRMATAFVKGVQSEKVVCTPKHFVANFEGDGGRDSFAVHFSERYLREVFFVPFEMCVREARPWSLMSAYNTLDGTTCTGSHWLLTEVLRDEWGFDGYVVSDYHSLVHIWELHKTATDKSEAARIAIEAGLDVELPRIDCYGKPLKDAVESGRVRMETVDRAVARVLTVKIEQGFFDDPFVDPDEAERVTNCAEHRALALEMSRQSLVLLRNEGGILPIASSARRIAVIGPNADSIEVGDYSWDLYTEEQAVTPLEGLRRNAPPGVEIVHAKGCELADENADGFAEAVELARSSDFVVMFVGSSVKLTGEARDRTELDLPGVQEQLIEAVAATGKPVAVVVITSSIHTITRWHGKVGAILHAWYQGLEGGNGIAGILFGQSNPSAKLPITIPRTVGQCPVYYFQKPSGRGNTYIKLGQHGGVLYPFGHGLSYTTYQYSKLSISPDKATVNDTLVIGCRVKNTGSRAGEEIVQLYMHDEYACVARPMMQLMDFVRVALDPGEEKEVLFTLPAERLRFLDQKMNWIFEPGRIEVMIGASCVDIRLRGEFEAV